MSFQSSKSQYLTLLLQIVVTVLLSVVIFWRMSFHATFSILLGGVVTVLPAWVFISCAFAHQGARAARQILIDFYVGTFLKFLSMGVLFYLFFTFFRIQGALFMLSFVLTQIVAIIAPRLFSGRRV